ncbi:LLM class F420-dependent oxidoreductase [Nocardia cyriacigeorgica]|uniref:LLM class F420-dependent oxidoreductase n=1 Tax=Nocardia cyriacigeorgica TaxID=135487 RepID=A0A6P1D301_9NOCA|nr:LLM class F420-dependent oxidoreductase [Nocardia cyriacigeorgica]NEW37459.1 LLM class F420-dependent oxidoreductase [Nocardia cyriacigeorgica]NEW44936.1 LLM class F420-dependent oxidoreductase [Nocardia cyriacigeorgica]NEW49153.1 LLM class F420-dependent oxidoreductase [Nocardia cyriacigeorgica]NEW56645.1 LLM class F420-dependent oxidoreductase [Nocardia cyriacigeorgica]
MTAQHEFRFGVNMVVPESRQAWIAKCRRAEAQGYDVIGVADHLGLPAPFPSMVLAAEATERVRLNTFVLNTPFYNPVLLARDVAGVDQFTDGRVELGLGAGYVRSEFEAAGIPFGSGGERVGHLENTVATLRTLFADPEYQPRPVQPGGPPLLIAGWGDRLLKLAAAHADVVAFTGAAATTDAGLRLAGVEDTIDRVGYVRKLLGERVTEVELNILVQAVVRPSERATVLDRFGALLPGDAPEELPTLLFGTPSEMAQQLRDRRDRFGFSYITVLEPNMDAFAPVIEHLR